MNLMDVVVLDSISAILHRPDTHIGSTSNRTVDSYIFNDVGSEPEFRDITYNPALLKLFDEVLQNTYDHHKRPGGSCLTRIDVNLSPMNGLISVSDNAGIPVAIHPVYKEYIPCIIFGHLNSSTNYNDDDKREGGGRNGLGSKLVNIFSSFFRVETCDGIKKYDKTYENNRRDETTPKITNCKIKGTKISFIPDYERLGCSLDKDNYGMIVTRVYEIAACAPNIDVYLNGKKIDVKGFEKFVAKFGKDYIYIDNSHWRIGLLHSDSGFKHISFCNATHTWLGGTHVEYLADQLVEGVRAHIKKKTKQDLKPSDIKNHFFLMVDCTVYNPRFSSQTKEHMNLAIKDYGTTFRFDEAFFKKLIKSPIVEEIVEWAINRKKLQDMADLKKLNKDVASTSTKNIPKYEPASQKTNREECALFICEGDSAANPLISARDPKKHGVFALRGKPLNMGDAKIEDIKNNKEIRNLMAALGLEFGKPATNLRYGKIVIATDADQDGMHIRALNLNNFYHAWPDLLTEGKVYYLHTPIVRVIQGKNRLEFFTIEEYETWFSKHNSTKMEVKFLKGLGGHGTPDFKKYMVDGGDYIIPMTFLDQDDEDMLNIAFGAADDKKVWLDCEQRN
jgi:DNA gyrase/topoisomerase IV subunit B